MLIKKWRRLKWSIKKKVACIEACFYKRNKNIVLLGSWMGEKFADNTRYIFQYLSENKESLGLEHVVWVTRNKTLCQTLEGMGYEVYMMGSAEAVMYHKIAGVHIVCNSEGFNDGDIDALYSYGAKCINLWHGIPLKSFGKAGNGYTERKRRIAFPKLNEVLHVYGWDKEFVLSTTRYTTEKLDKCFGIGIDKYIESAYPRNCQVPCLTDNEKQVIETFKEFDKIILYLPTFRGAGIKFDFTKFADVLKKTLADNNVLWVQKAHSVDSNNVLDENRCPNILSLNPEFDINVLLPHISFCVTDYSSVMFDAMYHKKPVMYLIPDIEEYRYGDRGLNITNPKEVMCGPVFFSVEELRDKLAYYCQNPQEAYRDDYYIVREKYWGKEEKTLADIWEDIQRKIW